MSGRKPVCKRFLKGDCNATNCNFFHPKGKNNQKPHHHTEHKPRVHTEHKPRVHTEPKPRMHVPAPEPTDYDSDDYLLPIERAMRSGNYEIIRSQASHTNTTYVQSAVTNNPVPQSIIQQPVAKPGTFGSKLITSKFAFDKTKFETWLNNDMPDVDSISIIKIFCNLMKKTESEIIEHITNLNTIIPDVMALIAHGVTNKKWLKELYGRFLGDSYTGIKSFSMKTIKDLLVFAIVQIYLKTQTQDFKNIEHMICLYICAMRLIGKFGIIIDIDTVDIIEKNYNNHIYDMICIAP
jgi:hypothetical protein